MGPGCPLFPCGERGGRGETVPADGRGLTGMTSCERVLAALRVDIPDRVPIWVWGVSPWLGEVHESVRPVVET